MSELKFTDQVEPHLPDGEPVEEQTLNTGKGENLDLKPTEVRQFYTELFFDMFVEALDIDAAFYDAKEEFVNALVAKGVQVNADRMIAMLDLMKDRFLQVSQVKRMAQVMGLQGELDKLVDLQLGYFASKFPQQTKTHKVVHPVAQGERKEE